ncbi:MAG: AtpZ/AtpI family protein [Anaerolineales bacterium]|jgi:F0F1-type ATP synthase assembly protein I|nr:AtpZ/AtpI family protein [Anaerolineales bacterium]
MNANPGPAGDNRREVNQGIVLGAVVGQVGCLTLLIVLAALFGGLWLDGFFNTKPFITIALMIASVPVTLVAMFWIVRKATARLQAQKSQKDQPSGQGGDRQ